jgi:hypothetical protein
MPRMQRWGGFVIRLGLRPAELGTFFGGFTMRTSSNAVALLSAMASALALPACSAGSFGAQPSAERVQTERRGTTSTSCLTSTCVYDYSHSEKAGAATQIVSFLSTATGGATPVDRVVGKKTKLIMDFGTHFGITVDSEHQLYTFVCANVGCGLPAVNIYAAGANGDAAPIATITGSNTGLVNGPDGFVAVDNDGDIYVASSAGCLSCASAVTVYPAGSNGNVTPTQTISGSNTGLMEPTGIAVDSSHNIYVSIHDPAGGSNDSIAVYAAGANGNAAPIQHISGTNTRLELVSGIALDSADDIYVANYASPNVAVFAAGATGNVEPIRMIFGTRTKLDEPDDIAVDAGGNVYVSNFLPDKMSSYITVYGAGANGNVKPSQRISGGPTHLGQEDATGIAVR